MAPGLGTPPIVEPRAFVEALRLCSRAGRDGLLNSRLQIALYHPRGTPESDLARFDQARRQFDDDFLRVAAIKLDIDDVVEPHTAALLEPYSDRPRERGD